MSSPAVGPALPSATSNPPRPSAWRKSARDHSAWPAGAGAGRLLSDHAASSWQDYENRGEPRAVAAGLTAILGGSPA
jgi:hypothetical protein